MGGAAWEEKSNYIVHRTKTKLVFRADLIQTHHACFLRKGTDHWKAEVYFLQVNDRTFPGLALLCFGMTAQMLVEMWNDE